MNTLYITNGGRVMLDQDNNPVNFNRDRAAIDDVWLLKEDAKIVSFDKNGNKSEKIGKAGDIVVSFWEDGFPHRIIVVSNDDWRNNIETYNAEEQRRKEEWAAKHTEPCCDECDQCEGCVKSC